MDSTARRVVPPLLAGLVFVVSCCVLIVFGMIVQATLGLDENAPEAPAYAEAVRQVRQVVTIVVAGALAVAVYRLAHRQ